MGNALRFAGLLLLSGSFAGCSSEPSELAAGDEDTRLVCPSCGERAGGETSDFGPDISPCAYAYAKREVDREEGDALGFPATETVRAIEAPIDAAMTWDALSFGEGGPASGYEPQTRVSVALEVRRLTLHVFDIDLCTDDGCRITAEEGKCLESFMMVNVSGELHTHDGAVAVSLPAQDVDMQMPDDDEVYVFAVANLRDVRGTLQLAPDFPEPRIGELTLSLSYTPEGEVLAGTIKISMYTNQYAAADEDGGAADKDRRDPLGYHPNFYHPLMGRWGLQPDDLPTNLGGKPQP